MIKQDDIQTRSWPFETRAQPGIQHIVEAQLVVSSKCQLTHLVQPYEHGYYSVERSEDRMREAVWHRLYGDILDEVTRLQFLALQCAMPQKHQDVEMAFRKLVEQLTYQPEEASDDRPQPENRI